MRSLLLSILLAFLCLSCGNSNGVLEVTYIANEGFMIAMGGTKVLIDALPQSSDYANPSDSMVSRLMNDVPPFDNLDFILVTHEHADHFNADLMSRFLRGHPAAQFLANPATNKMMGDSSVSRRRAVMDLQRGERRTIQGEKAEITVLRLDHGGRRDISNLAYLVRSQGYTIFHVGDARLSDNKEYLRTVDWRSYNVDLLFLEFFERDSEVQSILQEMIKPKCVIFMHIPAGEEEKVRKENAKLYPRTFVFGKEGETKRFDEPVGE